MIVFVLPPRPRYPRIANISYITFRCLCIRSDNATEQGLDGLHWPTRAGGTTAGAKREA